jgi:hypothetical protein
MKKIRIPSALALIIGILMAILGQRLPLHQGNVAQQTDGEYVAQLLLTCGGGLIALVAAFGLGRSTRD